MMSNLKFSVDSPGVAILGSEYCSGYIDLLGKWNNGFYCPSSDQTVNVFCCGSDSQKYCCTKKDQIIQNEMEGLTLVIGVLVGASTALLLLTIISCVCCPWCPNYKKKNMQKFKGSKYHPPYPGSLDSRVTTNYSVGNGANGSTIPLDQALTSHGRDNSIQYMQPGQLHRQGVSHSHTLPHSLSHHHSFPIRDEGSVMQNTYRKYSTAYLILPQSSYHLIPQDTPDLLRETRIQTETALASLSYSMAKDNMMEMDKEEMEEIYQSTQF